MPQFSDASKTKLSTCDPRLVRVFDRVVETFDCTIVCGHRGEVEQNKAFETGHSQKRWPESKHNTSPSVAVDATPYPIDWGDRERATFFAGFVLATAREMGIELTWGGDWNHNWQVKDNSFDDICHFEIREIAP